MSAWEGNYMIQAYIPYETVELAIDMFALMIAIVELAYTIADHHDDDLRR